MSAARPPRRSQIGLIAAAVAAVLLVTSLALLALGRMTEDEATTTAPGGAELATIPGSHGDRLAARLWLRHADRIAVLLHGFGGDQHDWDEAIEPLQEALEEPLSVLTFDFRGHGDSDGENRDLEGLAADVHSAVAFARSRGFTEIVLVGASVGGTAAIVAASEDPSIAGVIALSAPAQLGELDALAAVRSAKTPLALIAAEDDASAVESFEQLRDGAGARATLAMMSPGRAHGIELVDGVEVRERMARAIEALWADEVAE